MFRHRRPFYQFHHGTVTWRLIWHKFIPISTQSKLNHFLIEKHNVAENANLLILDEWKLSQNQVIFNISKSPPAQRTDFEDEHSKILDLRSKMPLIFYILIFEIEKGFLGPKLWR